MSTAHRKLNVVVLIDILSDAGGAEILAAALVSRLDPSRFERTMVVYRLTSRDTPILNSQEQAVARLRDAGVRVIELRGRNRFHVASWRPLVGMMRRGEVDVLHSHKFGPNLWGGLLTRIAPVPVFIAHEHTWSFEGRPLRRFLDRRVIASQADLVLTVSEEDRRRMIDLEGIAPERLRCLPNGIPAIAPPVSGAALRAEFAIPPEAPLIGAVGVMREQKDFPTLVRALALVRETRPETHLVIVGDGPLRGHLETLIEELRLGERVVITGFRSDATDLAGGFDIAVNSSLFEGASLAIMECMALGRPIVATAVGGTPELLDHGAAGVLVAPSDPRALADAISGLLADPDRAQGLGRRARERQQAEYDVDVQVRRLEDLYVERYDAAVRRGTPHPAAP